MYIINVKIVKKDRQQRKEFMIFSLSFCNDTLQKIVQCFQGIHDFMQFMQYMLSKKITTKVDTYNYIIIW